MNLKQRIYKLLLEDEKYRNNDKELVWRIWDDLGFIIDINIVGDSEILQKEDFMKAPDYKSIERCRRALQRTDLLTGRNLIQANRVIKENREKLSKEHGQSFQEPKFAFNPVTEMYEQV